MSSVRELLTSMTSHVTSRVAELFAPRSPKDPDLDQIFSDAVEREMIFRELHCR